LSSRQVKRQVRQALAANDWRERLKMLTAGEGRPSQAFITALLAALSSGQNMVRWRAVSFLGQTMAGLAGNDPEAARQVMRRLVWGLNEESGAVAWGAPEALGEIMAHSPFLAKEFVNLLLAYVSDCDLALDFAPLRAGAVWGLGRLAQARPGLLLERGAGEVLLALSQEADPQVRGMAVWALGWLGGAGVKKRLAELTEDNAEVELFDHEELGSIRIKGLARQALERL
jgi:hypothetical protein